MDSQNKQPEDNSFENTAIVEVGPSPEVQVGVSKLTGEINDLLYKMRERRDSGESLATGTTITEEPRIQQTEEESSPLAFTKNIETTTRAGISLTGDGVKNRLVLHVVHHGATTETVTIEGSDPIATLVHGERLDPRRRNEIIARLHIQDGDDYSGYELRGNGGGRRSHRSHEGVNTSQQLTPESLSMAQEALKLITDELLPAK